MTATIHRCPKCNHTHENHSELAVTDSCSLGWCPCRATRAQIAREQPAEQIPTFPGYNATTGKWAQR